MLCWIQSWLEQELRSLGIEPLRGNKAVLVAKLHAVWEGEGEGAIEVVKARSNGDGVSSKSSASSKAITAVDSTATGDDAVQKARGKLAGSKGKKAASPAKPEKGSSEEDATLALSEELTKLRVVRRPTSNSLPPPF